jgi:hypothetical protein
MKARLVLLTLWSLMSAAVASEWVYISISADDSHHVRGDLQSLSRNGDQAKAWVMDDFRTPQIMEGRPDQRFLSTKGLLYFRCKDRQYAIARLVYYGENSGEGEVVDAISSPPELKFLDVVPDTVSEEKLKWACSSAR